MTMTRGDTIDKAIAFKSDEDVVARIRERMPESMEMLDRIACGDVPRNAAAILKAIELQLRFTQPLPKQTIEHEGSVGIQVINPYALAQAEVEAIESKPPVKALPPVIRRRAVIEGEVIPSARVESEPPTEESA